MIRPVLTAMLGLLPALSFSQEKQAGQAPAQIDILVRVEWIEVAHVTLTTLMGDRDLRDGTKLRLRLQELVKARKAEIWDTAMVSARSGQKGLTQSQREWVYPTELDVSEGGPRGAAAAPVALASQPVVVPPTPDAFESREVGIVVEVEATRRAPGSALIDLRIYAEQVQIQKLVEHAGWKTKAGVASIKTPQFEVLRTPGHVALVDGSYAMIGVVQRSRAPGRKMIVMVRCDLLD